MNVPRCSGVCAMMRLLALFIHVLSTTAKRHVVYWNSTNTRLTGDDYSVQVNLSDYLDILCPHYPADHPSSATVETLALYLVAERQFRGCVETKEAIKRWECNQPYAPYGPVRFSEKIQRFTPFSLALNSCPDTITTIAHYPQTMDPPPLYETTSHCVLSTDKAGSQTPAVMLTFRSVWLMQDQQGMPPSKSGNGSPVPTAGSSRQEATERPSPSSAVHPVRRLYLLLIPLLLPYFL